jgi:hypothetical protein
MKTIDLRPLFATYLMFDAPYARHETRLTRSNENRQTVLTDFLTNF